MISDKSMSIMQRGGKAGRHIKTKFIAISLVVTILVIICDFSFLQFSGRNELLETQNIQTYLYLHDDNEEKDERNISFTPVKKNTIHTDLDLLGNNKERNEHNFTTPPVANRRNYLRYDDAGIRPIPGTARSHHLPFAVPERRTIPHQFVEDKFYHILQRGNTSSRCRKDYEYRIFHDYSTDHRTLYLYNPHILPLHNTIETPGSSESDPDSLSKKDLHALTGGDSSVRYLVTYRAFISCNCFGILPDRKIMKAGEIVSYLAIALLDENLDVINGTDVLIDLNLAPPFGGGNKYYMQYREDCRTFLIRGSMHIVCNSMTHRVRIRRTSGTLDDRSNVMTHPNSPRFDPTKSKVPLIFPNVYGYGLELTLLDESKQLFDGKNLNVFRALDKNNTYEYYLQTYPVPHQYHRLKVGSNLEIEGMGKSNRNTLPFPSFDTPDTNNNRTVCRRQRKKKKCNETPFFPDDVDHGTACCLPMDLEGSQVMVGISHVKLSKKDQFWKKDEYSRYKSFMYDQFLSRFVAYDTKPPFDIVARSGLFCLGYANEDEGRSEVNGSPLAGRNTQYRLELFNETFDCPPIHFPSSFSEVVGDKSKLIIGYGINDCHPRIMMVETRDVVNSLLGKM